VRDGNEVVYVAKLGGRRQAKSPSRIGGRMPTHCTAVGKVLLAHDDDLRRRVLAAPLPRLTPHTIVAPGLLRRHLDVVAANGVAFEHEESALGLACVACPVFGASGELAAAISITGPTSRFRPEAHGDAVRASASAISATLARRENPQGQIG
jgi:DNA-binding IclR family transcriptional regulator